MSSVNAVTLLGNLGKAPELRYLPNGEPVATFGLATSEKWTDKGGKSQERTEWHRVEIFGKAAEVAGKYLSKGSQVYVQGSLRYEEWEKDGIKRHSTKVRVAGPNSRLVLLGKSTAAATDREMEDDQVPF
jgi:single-strand DNA-binding protein